METGPTNQPSTVNSNPLINTPALLQTSKSKETTRKSQQIQQLPNPRPLERANVLIPTDSNGKFIKTDLIH